MLKATMAAFESQTSNGPCPLFDKLPREIRFLIYARLLVSPAPIDGAQALRLIRHKQANILLRPVPGLDARVLRTCRQAYGEGMSMLYANEFRFSSPYALGLFRGMGLPRQIRHWGRFRCLRSLTLTFLTSYSGARNGWTAWNNCFLNEDAHSRGVGFPALQDLTLEFSVSQLPHDQGLWV